MWKGDTSLPFEKTPWRSLVQVDRRGSAVDVRMGHGLLCVLGFLSLSVLLGCGRAQVAVLTQSPTWSTLFAGEFVTFTCAVREAEDGDWSYRMTKDGQELFPFDSKKSQKIKLQQNNNGEYQCFGSKDTTAPGIQSNVLSISVSDKPKAKLEVTSSDGRVTLTCSVIQPSLGWRYDWYRGKRHSEPLTAEDVVYLSDEKVSLTQEGLYWCRGRRGKPQYYTSYSDPFVYIRPVVTPYPRWSETYKGETVVLTCVVKDDSGTEWEYVWRKDNSEMTPENADIFVDSSRSGGGEYKCKGRSKRGLLTWWSNPFTLTVHNVPPIPALTVSPSWPSPGAPVTLSCSVRHPSAGWRFYWYVSVQQHTQLQLLPGSEKGTVEDSYIIPSPRHTAGYVCRAGRGDPVIYTDYSAKKFAWSTDFLSSPFLTVSPDRVQYFSLESVTLTCEGNASQWTVWGFSERLGLSPCSVWGEVSGPVCRVSALTLPDAVYWCESASGRSSRAVNITVSYNRIRLVSPANPVAEGTSVTLGCKMETEADLIRVRFYKDNKLIQSDARHQMTIPAASESHDGVYKCEGLSRQRAWTSPESRMSVKVTGPESSSFPWLLVIASVCGPLLVLLLLVLFCIKKSQDPDCIRASQSARNSQTSGAEQTCKRDVNEQHIYSSLLHGDVCIYESVGGFGDIGKGDPGDPGEGSE